MCFKLAFRFSSLLLLSAVCLPPRAVGELPARLRSDGIIGTIFLSNADSAPESVVDEFVDAAGGEDANLVIVVGGRKRPSSDEEKAILARWEKLEPADVHVISIGDGNQSDEAADAAKLREASGVWLTGIDAASLAASPHATTLAKQLRAVLDRRGTIGIEGRTCGLMANETFLDEKSATSTAGLNLLADCVVDPAFDSDAETSRLRDAIERKPNTLGIGLPKNATLVIDGRDIRPLDGSAYIVLPPGKNWRKRVVELSDHRPDDWNQLHRAARDRANPDYLPKAPALPEVANGSLVIIGGGGTPTNVLKRFIELAGGRDAQFVVFPTAMPDPINIGLESSFLKRAGVKHVAILPAREEKEVDGAENLEVLKKAAGVWFGGGRQWRFVDAYEGTKTAELLRDVLRRGGVIGGSSAGATIQGDYLVRGSPFGPDAMMCEGYERGLCFLPGVAIDQHFTARNRFADMTSLMEKYPQFLGIGIDESTALIVQGHTAEIMGKGKVHFYDRRKPTDPDGPDYEVAAAGDKYDFKERKVIQGEKVLATIAAQHPEPLPDKLVKAWRNAGAEVAWMSLDRFGKLYYNFELGDNQDAVPAFGFHDWKSGAVSKLPHPSRAFGLNLHDTPLDDAGLKEVAQLEHLQALILSGTNITDAGLKEVTRLKELQTLILSDTKVTDAGLNELADLKGLKTLNISFTPLTDDGIKKLARVKTLETLVASFTQITGSGLSELAGAESLKTLDLSKTKVTDSQLKELAALKNLHMLSLLYTPVTGSGLRQLAGLKNLEILDLFGSQVSDVGLKGLPELPKLQTLILDTTQITDAGLKELARLSNLETLYLGNTKITDSGLKELAALKKLHTLDLSFLEITGAGTKALDRLKHLKSLGLSFTGFTDASVKELSGFTSLEDLNLMGTNITGVGIEKLAGLQRLQTLNLRATELSDEGLKELAGLTSLKTLNLRGTHVTDLGLRELFGLKNLKTLDLSVTRVTDAGMKELKQKLPDCTILHSK